MFALENARESPGGTTAQVRSAVGAEDSLPDTRYKKAVPRLVTNRFEAGAVPSARSQVVEAGPAVNLLPFFDKLKSFQIYL